MRDEGLYSYGISWFVVIFVLLVIIGVLIFAYVLNYKSKYRHAVEYQNQQENTLENLSKIKYEIYLEIKNILENGIKWAGQYDQWKSNQTISEYRNSLQDELNGITKTFNYRSMKITDVDNDAFGIIEKLISTNPLYWEGKLETDLEKFYKWGENYGREKL